MDPGVLAPGSSDCRVYEPVVLGVHVSFQRGNAKKQLRVLLFLDLVNDMCRDSQVGEANALEATLLAGTSGLAG